MRRKNAYLNALQEVMSNDAPATHTEATVDELKLSLQIISKRLLGPLHNVERIWLVEDKREIQKQIAALQRS